MDDVDWLPSVKVCTDYSIRGRLNDSVLKWSTPRLDTVNKEDLREFVAKHLGVTVRITSHGPTYEDKKVYEISKGIA